MKKALKITAIVIVSIIVFVVVVAGGYVGYISAQYYRIEDELELEVSGATANKVELNQNYTVSTYNIGFGAYTQEFSFFMDTGIMLDGTAVSGTNSTAKDKATVLANTNGAISVISPFSYDFMLFQEVDTNSTRSHKVNQYNIIKENFSAYSSVFAVNFHSGYLMYPLNDPHGSVNSGIATLSSKQIDNAVRYSFPVDMSFPTKFFDLDRCFTLSYLPIEGSDKFFCLINIHMSAYDKGGTIRVKQVAALNAILAAEYSKGNYVVAGGDFNHDLINSLNIFPTTQQVPEWVYQLSDADLTEGYSFAAAINAPTCRSTDMAYTAGVNYTVVIDGFIVSDNVTVVNITNINADFEYSDHNPAVLTFLLNNAG
ncbi:MAG: endonuclease [Clostridia bacterium]|nr:endonuclease [Clostridia bacterium]